MDEVDRRLEQLEPGNVIFFKCPTPYCEAIGGKCASCGTTWSDCQCGYNLWYCDCGGRIENAPRGETDAL